MKGSKFILVIDAGTTGIQASLFDAYTLDMFGNNKVEFPQIYPSSGLVEHKPSDIWQGVVTAIGEALKKVKGELLNFTIQQIAAIGLTNQRETCLAWNLKSGEVAGNALVWQDRRTADFCQKLKKNESTRNAIFQKTGLICDPYFSASKMRWMVEHYPLAKKWRLEGELALGTIDSYLLFQLTGGQVFATEHTNASRTMVYNLETGSYDQELLNIFNLQEENLPKILPSSGFFGETKSCLGLSAAVMPASGLPEGIPILGILGDQQSALFGQNCIQSGEAKITFGTGAFLLMNTGEKRFFSQEGLLTTVAYSTSSQRTFALEGAAFIAGAAVQFLRDNFGWVKNSTESADLAQGYPRDEEILFVPSLAGLGAPYWNPHARGVLFGLSRGTQKAQIIRAVLESIALQNVQLLSLMEEASGQKVLRAGVDGGASRNDFLMQFQADTLQTLLVRPKNTETTSLGAARAAQVGLGIQEVSASGEGSQTFTPKISKEIAQSFVYRWLRAVESVNLFYQHG